MLRRRRVVSRRRTSVDADHDRAATTDVVTVKRAIATLG
jgi:hypothetical protein